MLTISSEHKWAYARVLRKQYHQTVDMLFKFYTLRIILNWLRYNSHHPEVTQTKRVNDDPHAHQYH